MIAIIFRRYFLGRETAAIKSGSTIMTDTPQTPNNIEHTHSSGVDF